MIRLKLKYTHVLIFYVIIYSVLHSRTNSLHVSLKVQNLHMFTLSCFPVCVLQILPWIPHLKTLAWRTEAYAIRREKAKRGRARKRTRLNFPQL